MARKKYKKQSGRGLITEAECARRNSLSNRFKSAVGVSTQPLSMKEKLTQGARDFQDKAREQLTSLQDNPPREPPPSDFRGLASAIREKSSARAVGGKKRGGKRTHKKKQKGRGPIKRAYDDYKYNKRREEISDDVSTEEYDQALPEFDDEFQYNTIDDGGVDYADEYTERERAEGKISRPEYQRRLQNTSDDLDRRMRRGTTMDDLEDEREIRKERKQKRKKNRRGGESITGVSTKEEPVGMTSEQENWLDNQEKIGRERQARIDDKKFKRARYDAIKRGNMIVGGALFKKSKKVKTTKKSKKSKKSTMNAYMKALQKAKKSNAESFEYKGKKYHRKKTKTGMVIYGAKKGGSCTTCSGGGIRYKKKGGMCGCKKKKIIT